MVKQDHQNQNPEHSYPAKIKCGEVLDSISPQR
jgi:hypothetical protein